MTSKPKFWDTNGRDITLLVYLFYINYIIRKNRPRRLLRRRSSRRHPLQSRQRNHPCCPRPRRPIRQRCRPTRQRCPRPRRPIRRRCRPTRQRCPLPRRPTLFSESRVRGRRCHARRHIGALQFQSMHSHTRGRQSLAQDAPAGPRACSGPLG
jgi:hypothetical protein